jgi:hypothetical protein
MPLQSALPDPLINWLGEERCMIPVSKYPVNFEVFSSGERKFSDWVEALCHTAGTNIMNLILGMRPSYWNELRVKPEPTYCDSDVN